MTDAAGAQPHDARTSAGELARLYDLDLAEDPGDLELYQALAARTGGPVLELGAGSGRLAVPLAASGLEVVALDLDPAMLDRARARWTAHRAGRRGGFRSACASSPGRGRAAKHPDPGPGSLELVEGDLLEAQLGPRFGLVVIALNSLLLLGTPERQGLALRAVSRHLRPGGLAAIDVWLPGPDDLVLYDGRVILQWIRDDTERNERVAKLGSARFDPATALVQLTTLYDSWPADGGPVRRMSRSDELRLIGASELVRLAQDAGLRVEALAADYSLTPFGTGAERAVFIGALV